MRGKKPDWLTIVIAICLVVIATGGAYLFWLHERDESIISDNQRYRDLRASEDTSIDNTASNSTPAPPRTEAASETVAASTPIPTPDSDTLHIGLPTAPPINSEYAPLLTVNSDFCGWLRAGSDIDLPVVYRQNDNETYLTTNLEGNDSAAGTLFVDGYNRLYPADTLTVIYGHNMSNGEMFGCLHRFESPDYLLSNSIVTFDTLYGDGRYVPFAAFYASTADVNIRQFQPTVEAFNALIDQFHELSLYDNGIDARYGDELLALVTCAGNDSDRRFFLICRKLREGETEMSILVEMEAALGE